MPNLLGLSVGLKEEAGQKLELIQVTKHLAVLTAGEPESDPMSALTSNMRQVLHEASAKFDWVIIDTPPVGLLPTPTCSRRWRWRRARRGCGPDAAQDGPARGRCHWRRPHHGLRAQPGQRDLSEPRATTTSTTGAATLHVSRTDALQAT